MNHPSREKRETMILRSLFRLSRRMGDQIVERMEPAGFTMSQAWIRMLGNVDVDGTRLGPLARRLGVTRQGASQLGKELEDAGYLERIPDPADRRGAILRFAPRGRAALTLAVEVMTQIEQEYAAIVGEDDYVAMKRTLGRLAAQIDPEGGLGLD